ncbi:MAG: HAMP domain-containing histidine kinase [Robiginitomaculum sp.]|nr:HAMP domain-containing histidine kinase [Robiginitomaculum sp.]
MDFPFRPKSSLGRRLLWLTILFVMLAQITIFLPSASAFRGQWLQDRVQAARLVVIGVEVAEDMMVSEEVALQMLETARIRAVRINRDGISEIILPAPLTAGSNIMVDLRNKSIIYSLGQTFNSLVFPQAEYLRVRDSFGSSSNDFLEVVVLESDLRAELIIFSIRTFWISLLISILAGALIYTTLLYVLVRPMHNLSMAMVGFREQPQDPTRIIVPSGRTDEIGIAEKDLRLLQKEVLQTLNQKTRLAALGEAVAKINHDMRNILTSAQLVSDRLASSKDPKIRKMGERLVRSIDRGVNLSRTTLEYGRSTEPEPEPQNLSLFLALEDAWLDACTNPNCKVQWINNVPRTLDVRADPDHLYRILVNLLRNATQALQGSGNLQAEITSSNVEARLHISDNGPGIPDHIRKNLFSPFSGTASKDGSGLGLAIARELARANNGDLDLLETSKNGTKFIVKLRLV